MLYYMKRILYGGGGEHCEEIHYSPNENILKNILILSHSNHASTPQFYIESFMIDMQL